MMIVAGDIGGTNTRLVCEEQDSNASFRFEKDYRNVEFADFPTLLEKFLSQADITCEIAAACFAVAGPVVMGRSSLTNLPWIISEEEISRHFQIPRVELVNDFIAVAYGVERLAEKDLLVLQQGSSVMANTVNPSAAIIGAGTGLGVAHRVWLTDHYQVFSSEAGHVGFAPENELQSRLLVWLQQTHAHVSLETLLSGHGLATIYRFFLETCAIEESKFIRQAMHRADPAQVIGENAVRQNDTLCQKALECFIDIYGAAAGNVALHYYPVDEVYIAGGIAPKVRQKLLPRFVDAFTSKGLMSDNMKNIKIKLILNDKVGLLGAKYLAVMLV